MKRESMVNNFLIKIENKIIGWKEPIKRIQFNNEWSLKDRTNK